MIVSHLISAVLIVSLTLYAILLIVFQKRANEVFGRITKAVGSALKFICTLLLRIVRSILKDIITILDAVLGWLKGK